jgi:cAMP-dependent protein kinase regulator
LALLYNCPRAATVQAKTDCILWAVDRETFNNIVKEAAQKKRVLYENFLKSVEILSSVDPYELSQIADALKTSYYNKGDFVIREGEIGDVFYIIVDGNAVATKTKEPGKPPVEVKKYEKGSYFGELALIRGEPRAANVAAETALKVISLDRNSFKRLLGPIEEILKRNSDQYVKFVQN